MTNEEGVMEEETERFHYFIDAVAVSQPEKKNIWHNQTIFEG